jgi:hypothetical protein
MIIRNKFNGYINGNNRLYPGGGGGPTQSTSYNTNIPEYARPYVEQMLGSTQKQIFTGTGSGKDFKPTGFNPYTPYGSTYEKDETGAPLKDASGNIMYTNTARQQAQAAVAPQSYGQQAATFDINNYRNPNQTSAASQMTADLAGRSAASGYYSPMQAERFQLGAPQQVRTDSFTQPGVSQGYMSPYMQNVVNAQQREARRAGEIQRNQNQAQAVNAGAFGGSRQAIMEAERQRNLGTQLGDIQAQGLQSAYQQGMGQFNTEQNAYLQAQQANQQANMQTGIQNLQAQQQAQQQQEQSRQFGAGLQLQGYDQAGKFAGQLGQLGQQQYGQEMGRIQAMADMGAKDQAQEQAIINQQIQNYATQQQYPYMQLGIMSNMLRGLPMQAGTTNMYQAQPMGIQQAIGMAGALGSLGTGRKEGGVIKMASGGVASGVDRYELPGMARRLSDPQLQQKLADQQTDPETMGIMQAESQRRVNTRKAAMAGGGMIAFAKGGTDEVDNPFKDNPYPIREDIGAEKKPVTPTDKAKKKVEASAPKAKAKDMYSEYDESMEAAQKGAFSDTKKQLVEREKALPALQAEADKSIATRVADMRQTNKDLGIEDKHTKALRDSFEQQIAASLEESKEEAKLRKAQAWAVFGSTPGPLLKVGLQALSGYIDDKIADEAKRKKMQSELKKSLYELDRSSYLESVGMAKEAREHHLTAFKTVNDLRDKIADDRRALETKDYEFKKDIAGTKLKAKEREQERKLTLEAARISKGSNLNEEKLDTKQTQLARAALEAFDKSEDGKKLSNYESMKSLAPDGFKAVQKDYERLKKKQDDLKIDLQNAYSRAKGLDTAPAPSTSGGASVTTADGKTYTFPNAEAAQKFKTAAGIK